MNDALLNVAGVTVRAGDRALLSEVSFQARAGEPRAARRHSDKPRGVR